MSSSHKKEIKGDCCKLCLKVLREIENALGYAEIYAWDVDSYEYEHDGLEMPIDVNAVLSAFSEIKNIIIMARDKLKKLEVEKCE